MKRAAIGVLLCLVLAACGGGGGGGGGQSSALGLNVVGPINVPVRSMSFRLERSDLASAELVEPFVLPARKFGDSWFVLSVPLELGANALRFRAVTDTGDEIFEDLSVVSSGIGMPAVLLEATPARCEIGDSVQLQLQVDPALGAVVETWLDVDGDGGIDSVEPAGTDIQLKCSQAGILSPRATVRTQRGLLLTSDPTPSTSVACFGAQPIVPERTWSSGILQVVDIEAASGSGEVFALSETQRVVHHFDSAGALLGIVDVSSAETPRGLALDAKENLLVADAGAGSIIRFSRASSYGLDLSFGHAGQLNGVGTTLGALAAPSDVCVVEGSSLADALICVSDSGNHRIAMFKPDGSAVGQFRGDESGGPAMVSPVSICTLGPAGVVVLDSQSKLVRTFEVGTGEVSRWGQASGVPRFDLSAPVDLAVDPRSLEVSVLDRGSGRLLQFSSSGKPVFTISPSLSFHAIQMSYDNLGPVLLGSREGASSEGVDLLRVPQEPVGSTALDAVASFVAAVLASDFETVKAMCQPNLQQWAQTVFADPAKLASVQAVFSTLAATRVVERSGPFVRVQAANLGSGEPDTVQWILVRRFGPLPWAVASL